MQASGSRGACRWCCAAWSLRSVPADLLHFGNTAGMDYAGVFGERVPLTREISFAAAFAHFERTGGKRIVEVRMRVPRISSLGRGQLQSNLRSWARSGVSAPGAVKAMIRRTFIRSRSASGGRVILCAGESLIGPNAAGKLGLGSWVLHARGS
jgi:hypothetical protein